MFSTISGCVTVIKPTSLNSITLIIKVPVNCLQIKDKDTEKRYALLYSWIQLLIQTVVLLVCKIYNLHNHEAMIPPLQILRRFLPPPILY